MHRYVILFLILCSVNGFAQSIGDTVKVRDLATKVREKRYWATAPDSMLYYSNIGMKMAMEIDDQYGIADMEKYQGIYYWSTGDHGRALEHYGKAKTIYDKLGRKHESVQVLSNFGMVYSRLGDSEKALRYYQEAITAMEAEANPDITSIAATTSSVGLLLRNFNDLEGAASRFHRAIELYAQTDDPLNLAGTYANLATVYSRKLSFDSATLYNELALRIFKDLDNARGQVIALNNLGFIANSNQKYPEAILSFTQSYELNKDGGFFDSQISSLLGIGEAKIGQRKYDEAERYFREALGIAKSRSRVKLIEVYKGLATSLRGQGKTDAAFEYYTSYDALKDSIYNKDNATAISNLRISHDLDRKDASIKLLEKDNRIAVLTRNLTFAIGAGLLILFALLIYNLREKSKKDRTLMQQQQELHQARHAMAEAELEHRKLREEELHRELEFRNRALTTYTLNLVQKNGMLDDVREVILDVLKQPDNKEADLRKLIRLIDYSFTLDKDWDGFKTYFEQVHPEFFRKLKESFPQLTATELRLCALIRLSLSIKESATVLSISPDSVKVSRHRLRKKLALNTDDNLTQFIMSV
jgi:tetratricopeptide (TPR) repeat protein